MGSLLEELPSGAQGCHQMPSDSSLEKEESQVWAAFVKNHAKENKPAFFVDARTPCQIQLTFAGTNDYTTGQAHKDEDGGVLVG